MNHTHIKFSNVDVADDIVIEDFAILGKPYRNATGDISPVTTIGKQSVIRSHTVIYSGVTIGSHFTSGHHVTVREHTNIGDHVSLGTGCVIEHHVALHNHVRLHSNVFVPEYCILKDYCWVGPNVVFTNSRYPASKDSKNCLEGVTLMEYARVGANTTILPGVTVGKHCLIGAGSVVVADVADGTVVAGNPARVIGSTDLLPY